MKKNNLIKLAIFLLIGIFLISLISSQVSYCCEKTTYGAWCQNEEESKCSSSFQKAPTSCEATSFCRQGCCFNSQEGNCIENTPQKICMEKKGLWNANSNCEIPQCDLGCCLIGNQAAFVTQTRCKRLSNLYGLSINFKTEIGSETECILSATSDIEGACVFAQETEITCKRTTQKECNEMEAKGESGGFFSFFENTEVVESSVEFYEGKLCTNAELETNCAPSQKTTCIEGEDAVYFLDTCGNKANVYDAGKYNDQNYWAEIKDVAESCGYGESNANSRTCGNCDYFYGTTCKKFERGVDAGSPNIGDYICRDLGCTYEGVRYEHGESFCAVVAGGDLVIGEDATFNEENLAEKNQPGSRYFRLLCYNSEIIVEPCADFRTEVCIQDEINGYRAAACRVNRWQDCTSQTDEEDCENEDKRDCIWFDVEDVKGCAPKYSPGFDFWENNTENEGLCKTADVECTMEYTKPIGGSWNCEENCECDDDSWKTKMNNVCGYIGDCGSKNNYLGYQGFFSMGDLYEKESIEKD